MIAEMSNLRRSSYSMLINVMLFRRFWLIVLRCASFILLSVENDLSPVLLVTIIVRYIRSAISMFGKQLFCYEMIHVQLHGLSSQFQFSFFQVQFSAVRKNGWPRYGNYTLKIFRVRMHQCRSSL